MGMQDQVQATVLGMIGRDEPVETALVRDRCPDADYRDVYRAVQLLDQAGFISRVEWGSQLLAPQLTALGRARLGGG
jgi:hypothetical protein